MKLVVLSLYAVLCIHETVNRREWVYVISSPRTTALAGVASAQNRFEQVVLSSSSCSFPLNPFNVCTEQYKKSQGYIRLYKHS